MKRFLGVYDLTPSHASQHALPDPAAARSNYLSVKKRWGLKSVRHSAVSVRVFLKYRDPSECGSSGYAYTCECTPPSDTQINILLSFPETSVL